MCIRDRATAGLGDFIIPLRLKDIPFSELPIQIHNKNAIDFMCGWHLGLARLLEKLEKDGTPVSYTHLDVYKRQALGSVEKALHQAA